MEKSLLWPNTYLLIRAKKTPFACPTIRSLCTFCTLIVVAVSTTFTRKMGKWRERKKIIYLQKVDLAYTNCLFSEHISHQHCSSLTFYGRIGQDSGDLWSLGTVRQICRNFSVQKRHKVGRQGWRPTKNAWSEQTDWMFGQDQDLGGNYQKMKSKVTTQNPL